MNYPYIEVNREPYNCANNNCVNYPGCVNKQGSNYPGYTVLTVSVIIVNNGRHIVGRKLNISTSIKLSPRHFDLQVATKCSLHLHLISSQYFYQHVARTRCATVHQSRSHSAGTLFLRHFPGCNGIESFFLLSAIAKSKLSSYHINDMHDWTRECFSQHNTV